VGAANASPLPTFETNIEGTWTLLEACRQGGVERVVVASSDKAYGPHERLPYTEDAALVPTFPYDVSKAAADLIARSYWHTYGLPVAVTRFANIYGGCDLNFSRLIPEAATAVLDGRAPLTRSDGSPERDFLYVEDVAAAYVAIAKTLARGEGAGEAFNGGWGRPNSVLEVVELICEIGGLNVEPEIQGTGNPEGEIDRQYVDSTKIREATGWEPRVDLREGLSRTLEWYREHPEARPAQHGSPG
jgi:CDP-glucose 4,6-dehydratase